VEITRLDTGPCRLFVKLESPNPGGSIKDRIVGLSAMAKWHAWRAWRFANYSHEWHISGCFILGLAAVLASLLVLFGLKYGLVTSMLTALAEDPENREIKPLGSGHYTAVWFRGMRGRPEVAFVSPHLIFQLAGDRARIELFARDSTPGWDVWGDEL
jgi:hypothetical protein